MKNIKIFAILVPACLLLSSCVTILGKRTTISIYSNPSGAAVYADGKYVGITPLQYKSKKPAQYLTFNKSGYREKGMYTSTKFRASTLWNFLFTGVIGFCVDIPYMQKYSTKQYTANLVLDSTRQGQSVSPTSRKKEKMEKEQMKEDNESTRTSY